MYRSFWGEGVLGRVRGKKEQRNREKKVERGESFLTRRISVLVLLNDIKFLIVLSEVKK